MANAASRKQVDQAARREKGARHGELADLRSVMEQPRGRSLIYRLLAETGAEGVLAFSPNAMTLARDVGVQSIGHWLLSEVREACPELELTMRREAAILAQRADMQEELNDEHSD